MAKVNISISDDLKEGMVGLNVNWSAVAQEAFAHAVNLEQLKGEGKDMDAGLARLRGDKHRHSQREEAEGIRHGKDWALETATYDELQEAVTSHDWASHPDKAVHWVNVLSDKLSLGLPGMPKSDVSASYALGFLRGASDILSKV